MRVGKGNEQVDNVLLQKLRNTRCLYFLNPFIYAQCGIFVSVICIPYKIFGNIVYFEEICFAFVKYVPYFSLISGFHRKYLDIVFLKNLAYVFLNSFIYLRIPLPQKILFYSFQSFVHCCCCLLCSSSRQTKSVIYDWIYIVVLLYVQRECVGEHICFATATAYCH